MQQLRTGENKCKLRTSASLVLCKHVDTSTIAYHFTKFEHKFLIFAFGKEKEDNQLQQAHIANEQGWNLERVNLPHHHSSVLSGDTSNAML
jgi:hypothetical protein